jgi:hypothetical protein
MDERSVYIGGTDTEASEFTQKNYGRFFKRGDIFLVLLVLVGMLLLSSWGAF